MEYTYTWEGEIKQKIDSSGSTYGYADLRPEPAKLVVDSDPDTVFLYTEEGREDGARPAPNHLVTKSNHDQ